MSSWMYIVECRDGSYYVGKANNLHYRIGEHSGRIPTTRHSRYVQRVGFRRLVYFEEFATEREALEREATLKKWHPVRYVRGRRTPVRAYKEYLVTTFPQWQLAAFEATAHDSELRGQIRLALADGKQRFAPEMPMDWWRQKVKRARLRTFVFALILIAIALLSRTGFWSPTRLMKRITNRCARGITCVAPDGPLR